MGLQGLGAFPDRWPITYYSQDIVLDCRETWAKYVVARLCLLQGPQDPDGDSEVYSILSARHPRISRQLAYFDWQPWSTVAWRRAYTTLMLLNQERLSEISRFMSL
jgi:hypothetical protein